MSKFGVAGTLRDEDEAKFGDGVFEDSVVSMVAGTLEMIGDGVVGGGLIRPRYELGEFGKGENEDVADLFWDALDLAQEKEKRTASFDPQKGIEIKGEVTWTLPFRSRGSALDDRDDAAARKSTAAADHRPAVRAYKALIYRGVMGKSRYGGGFGSLCCEYNEWALGNMNRGHKK
ncbi:hypothetical protein Drorol1_Dr00002043 [Drosera rotundifolia]